jgi:xylulose-5-phosphate/fructose-6-phosphate phosphoketolase
MRLQPPSEHPHGLSDPDFDALFTKDKPIIFAYHGYPWLIHRLSYRRTNHENLHVRGYKEEGTTTTPFDMVVLNDLDRFHLVGDVVDRVPSLGSRAAHVKQLIRDKLIDHKIYIREHGQDMPACASGAGARPSAPTSNESLAASAQARNARRNGQRPRGRRSANALPDGFTS